MIAALGIFGCSLMLIYLSIRQLTRPGRRRNG